MCVLRREAGCDIGHYVYNGKAEREQREEGGEEGGRRWEGREGEGRKRRSESKGCKRFCLIPSLSL